MEVPALCGGKKGTYCVDMAQSNDECGGGLYLWGRSSRVEKFNDIYLYPSKSELERDELLQNPFLAFYQRWPWLRPKSSIYQSLDMFSQCSLRAIVFLVLPFLMPFLVVRRNGSRLEWQLGSSCKVAGLFLGFNLPIRVHS